MGDKDRANRDFSLIIYFGVLVAVLLELIILPNIDFIVKSLGAQSGDLYTYTKDYLFILTLFTPLFLLQIIFQGFLFVEGNGKLALILTVICGLANVLFDYLFIAILDLGIVGAAYGTSIGFLIGAIGGLYFFLKNKKGLHLGKFSRNMRVIVGTLTNGSSEMVTNVSTAITTFMFNALTLKYAGADGVAAITIILYCQFLFCSIFFGFSMGASPLIGYAWGAKKYKYTRDLLRLCYKLVIIFQLIMFAISITQASLIASMFTSSDNPVFGLSTHGLRIFSFSFLFCGISIFSSSVFTALGDGKRSAFLSFVRVFVFTIFFLYTLPLIWGLDGIWLAIPIAEALMVIIDIIFLVKLSHRLTDFSHEKKLRAI